MNNKEEQYYPVGTKVKLYNRGYKSELAEHGVCFKDGTKGLIDCLNGYTELGNPEYEYYNIELENGYVIEALSGYHIEAYGE